ncbi:hypothetical protein PGTUg99_004229 [Puccinia graminis f. sp. tritici]|uniref:Uncharacterized protein n=1 Tax=Puccinia graminis f. sp. tritici TaxID=56615 RepID=A0A5B0SGT5_PUCGR|nr:hypothetical protein PGTUg99_004229 [Puccinia graminis f. sp. tritici]
MEEARERSKSRVVFHPAVSGHVGQSELVPADPGHQALLHPAAQVVLRLDPTLGLVSLVGLETSQISLHERRAVVEVVQRERASVRRTHRECVSVLHLPLSFVPPSSLVAMLEGGTHLPKISRTTERHFEAVVNSWLSAVFLVH